MPLDLAMEIGETSLEYNWVPNILTHLIFSNLDLQAECNLARPYFYAYEDPTLSFTNYRNSLAHPLGANFNEIF